jgi:hypothetical protein
VLTGSWLLPGLPDWVSDRGGVVVNFHPHRDRAQANSSNL